MTLQYKKKARIIRSRQADIASCKLHKMVIFRKLCWDMIDQHKHNPT